ncbi:MAG TPA: hypothetical protein PLX05_10910 [Acinetobacter parvus]|jgi:hypothetical protein|uniref:hypothetical protein n=1 Tax=Acinetobacter TaxID=469 RepID=UPI0002CEA549|nr:MULTISPECIES: hypothetical protein [Acinetobacter]ENV07141.1 hypothetical protein F967_00506 [Acinetobacter sp. CIP 102637]HRM16102.1 hypothetical protein [Acinetobacter parvus]
MNLLKDGYGLGALLHSSLAKQAKALYPKHAQQKAAGLALTGYNSLAHTVRFMGFFCMCNISMHSHVMAKLERDIFGCAGFLTSLSVNPFQLCHHYLTVIGKASKQSLGAHNHA